MSDVTLVNLEKALETYIKTFTKLQVIATKQGAPRPHGNYITYEPLVANKNVGFDERVYISDNTFLRRGHREAVYQVECYRDGALQIMSDLKDSFESESAIDFFGTYNIAVFHINDIMNLSTALDTKFEQRFSMDVYLRYVSEKEETITDIDKVEVSATITTDNGEIDTEQTI